jgi:hypothetical protein
MLKIRIASRRDPTRNAISRIFWLSWMNRRWHKAGKVFWCQGVRRAKRKFATMPQFPDPSTSNVGRGEWSRY